MRTVFGLSLLFMACVVIAQEPMPKEKAKELTTEQKELVKEARKWDKETSKLREEGKLKEAIAAAEKMLAAEMKVYGELHEEPVGSLKLIATMQEQLEQFGEAKKTRQRLIDLQTKRFGKEEWRVTDARTALQSLEIVERLSENDRSELRRAEEENTRLVAEYRKGNFDAAARMGVKVLATRKKLLGENHPDYATSLNNLALLYHSMGVDEKAEPLFLQAKDLTKKLLGENHPDYANSLNNLAALYHSMGAYEKAEPLYLQARNLRKQLLDENHPSYARSLNDYATSLNNLAALYHSMGAYEKAELLYLQARDLRKQLLGENHPDYADILNNLAGLYSSMRAYEKAELLYLQAKDLRKKLLGENHPDYADSLNNLAALYGSMGAYEKAEPLYLQAKDLRKKLLGENHPSYAGSLNNLAGLYRAMGAYEKAEPLYLQAVERIAAQLERTAEGQGEAGQMAYADSTRFYLDNLLFGTRERASVSTYDLVFRLRGAITARQLFRRASRGAAPELKASILELQQVTHELSHLANTVPDPKKKLDLPAKMQELTERYEKLHQELAAGSESFAEYQKQIGRAHV